MSEQPKRVGRPAKKPELGRRKNVMFRLNEQVMDRVQAFAAEHGRSASEEIERRIEASFHDDDAMRVIRETVRQEMRAEFAGRRETGFELYRQATAYQPAFGQSFGLAQQQYLGFDAPQFTGQHSIVRKTEPEKA